MGFSSRLEIHDFEVLICSSLTNCMHAWISFPCCMETYFIQKFLCVCVCVCGTNRKIHVAKNEENNLRTTTKGIIFIELLSCAQLLRSCIILFRTPAGWQLLPWTAGVVPWQIFVSSQLQYARSRSPYYNCLLRSCYPVNLHRHKMVSDQICTHRFW
jgi:hypothetical protein